MKAHLSPCLLIPPKCFPSWFLNLRPVVSSGSCLQVLRFSPPAHASHLSCQLTRALWTPDLSPLFSAVWVHLSHFRSPPRGASFLEGLLEGRGCATTFRALNHGEQELPAFGVGRTLLTFEMPSHVKIPFNVCFSEILLKMCYLEQVLLTCVVNCLFPRMSGDKEVQKHIYSK